MEPVSDRVLNVELRPLLQDRRLDGPVLPADLLDRERTAAAGVGDRVRDLRRRGSGRLELVHRAALEVDAELQAEDQQRRDADHQDRAGDLVPELLPADEVERHLAAVQPAAGVTEPGHHASFGVVLATGAGVAAAPPGADLAVAAPRPPPRDRHPGPAGTRP